MNTKRTYSPGNHGTRRYRTSYWLALISLAHPAGIGGCTYIEYSHKNHPQMMASRPSARNNLGVISNSVSKGDGGASQAEASGPIRWRYSVYGLVDNPVIVGFLLFCVGQR